MQVFRALGIALLDKAFEGVERWKWDSEFNHSFGGCFCWLGGIFDCDNCWLHVYVYLYIYIYQDTGNIFYIVLNIVVCLLDMKLKIPVVKFRFMQDQNQLAVIWSEYNQKQIKQGCLSHPVQTYASNWIISLCRDENKDVSNFKPPPSTLYYNPYISLQQSSKGY